VKKFLFASLILLSGCLPLPGLAPGFYAGATDVTIKSKEVLSGTECKWRCYKNKKK
jgi:hypothetical protein|tara:strand:- start:155 stop:322 length:168 start_codon:yes stop_codon:yes gene_type:complete